MYHASQTRHGLGRRLLQGSMRNSTILEYEGMRNVSVLPVLVNKGVIANDLIGPLLHVVYTSDISRKTPFPPPKTTSSDPRI